MRLDLTWTGGLYTRPIRSVKKVRIDLTGGTCPRPTAAPRADQACDDDPALLPRHPRLLAATRRHVADDGRRGPVPRGDHRAPARCHGQPGRVRSCVRLRHHHRVARLHVDERVDGARRGRGELPRAPRLRVPAGGGGDRGAGRPAAAARIRRGRPRAAPAGRRGGPDARRPRHPAPLARSHRLPPVPTGDPDPPRPDPARRERHGHPPGRHVRDCVRRVPCREPAGGPRRRARPVGRSPHRSSRQPLHDPHARVHAARPPAPSGSDGPPPPGGAGGLLRSARAHHLRRPLRPADRDVLHGAGRASPWSRSPCCR